MGLRAAVGHEFIAQAPRERQVRERSMQVTELPAAQAEFDAAEPVLMDRHTFPPPDRGPHPIDRILLAFHGPARNHQIIMRSAEPGTGE